MFLPDYVITNKTLNSIAVIERASAVIENATLMQTHEDKLLRQAQIDTIHANLLSENRNYTKDEIKRYLDNLTTQNDFYLANMVRAIKTVREMAVNRAVEDIELKTIHKVLGANILPKNRAGSFRSFRIKNAVLPEEILANIVELTDWINSYDAMETHPLLILAISKIKLDQINPFDEFNFAAVSLFIDLINKTHGDKAMSFVSLADFFWSIRKEYEKILQNNDIIHEDYTQWIEFFCEGITSKVKTIEQEVLLLAKDTKIAKTTGRVNLTERQEKIVTHLQDYGILTNKHFPALFPGVSEDSVLRDLKRLTEMGIVAKRGKTKSSRYELK